MKPSRAGGRRVLIAGCGYVGQALGRRLQADGHQVWGLKRDSSQLPEEIQPVAADLGRPESLNRLPPNLDYLVYATAADSSTEEAYRRAYVEGASNLAAALHEQGQEPRRLFFVSSTAVYGQDGGEWVDESSPTEPPRFNGQIMLEAERRLAEDPWPATVVRLGGIYGPTRTRGIRGVVSGEVALHTGPPIYSNRIHRDDCAGALAHLLELDSRGKPIAALYVGVDEDPAERNEVVRWLVETLQMPEPEVGTAAPGRRRGGNKRCSSARLRGSGYRFLYPTFREGYASLLDEALAGS